MHWGTFIWFFLHSSSLSYKNKGNLTEEETRRINEFINTLCHYLPCPICRPHCMEHTIGHPPVFKTGEEYWRWTVDFHNAVNARGKKRQFTYEESELTIAKKLEQFDLTTDKFEDAFLQDYWTTIFVLSPHYSTSPNKPPSEDVEKFTKFMENLSFIVPFRNKQCNDKTCGQLMLDFVQSEKFKIDSHEEVFETISTMFNELCTFFGVLPRSLTEQREKFFKGFTDAPQLLTNQDQRVEDHAKIDALQNELNALRNGNKSNDVSDGWKKSTIALSILLALVLIICVVGYIYYRGKQCFSPFQQTPKVKTK